MQRRRTLVTARGKVPLLAAVDPSRRRFRAALLRAHMLQRISSETHQIFVVMKPPKTR